MERTTTPLSASNSPEDAEISNDDAEEVEVAVRNYVEGAFAGDPERIAKSVHPNLFKVRVVPVEGSGEEYLRITTLEMLLTFARDNGDKYAACSIKSFDIVFMDSRCAVACAVSDEFYDICTLAKMNGRWMIVEVLWAMNE